MRNPASLLLPVLSLAATASAAVIPRSGSSFSGVNNYYVPGLPHDEQLKLLQGMSDSGMQVLRIFIQGFDAGAKGSSNRALPDVEAEHIGAPYDDTILDAIDDLMINAHAYGVKLLISMYDKNTYQAGGVYQDKYPDNALYTDSGARVDFNNRITYILNGHKHKTLNKPWSELGNYIFGYDVMNEPMINDGNLYTSNAGHDWICKTASQIRGNVGDRAQLIFTGGSSAGQSVQDAFFQDSCSDLDGIAIHDYTGAMPEYLPDAINKAQNAGKKIIVEEWGSEYGSGREGNMRWNAGRMSNVPWLYWELITNENPGEGENYEITVYGDDGWSTLRSLAEEANAKNGPFDFSESLKLE